MDNLKTKFNSVLLLLQNSFYSRKEIEVFEKLNINRNVYSIRFLLIAFLTIAILQLVAFFIIDKHYLLPSSRYHYPYVYNTIMKSVGNNNARFFSARYPRSKYPLLVRAYPHLQKTEITIEKEKHFTFFQGKLEGHYRFNFWPVDVNNDSLDEIISVKPYPYFELNSSPYKADSLNLVIIDGEEKSKNFYSFKRPASISKDELWGYHVAPFNDPDLSRHSQTDSVFAVIAYGQGKNYHERYLYLFNKTNKPEKVARLKVPFYPSTGSFYRDEHGRDMFVFGGSSPSNGISVYLKEYLPGGKTREGKYWDDEGIFIQYDVANQKVQWALRVGKSGGETRIFVPKDKNKPLVGLFFKEAFNDSPENKTYIYKINRKKGEIQDSLVVSNLVRIFSGKSAAKCGYIGLVKLEGQKYQLIDKEGDLDKVISLEYPPDKKPIPVLELKNGGYGFLINDIDDNHCYLFDFNGDILSKIEGIINDLPKYAYYENEFREILRLVNLNNEFVGYIYANSNSLWLLNKYSRILLLLILPHIVLLIIYLLITQIVLRRRLQNVLIDSYHLRDEEASQIGKQLDITQIYAESESKKRQSSENRLKISNKRLHTIIDLVDEAVLTVDKNKNIIEWNSQALKILELKAEDIDGSKSSSVSRKNIEIFSEIIEHTFKQQGGIRGLSLKYRNKSKKFKILKVDTSWLKNEHADNEVLLIFKDISEMELNKKDIDSHIYFDKIIGRSMSMAEVLVQIETYADKDCHIYLTGEPGSGTSLFAQVFHAISNRAEKPYKIIDCKQIPDKLVENHIFGYEKLDSDGRRIVKNGVLDHADGGIVCIDDIELLPYSAKINLLRLASKGYFQRQGSQEKVYISIRILGISKTEIEGPGSLFEQRPELFDEMDYIKIKIPALRDRKEDIALLTALFLRELNENIRDIEKKSISNQALAKLIDYKWPGNVLQLKEVLITAFNKTQGNVIQSDSLFFAEEALARSLNRISEHNSETGTGEQEKRAALIKALKKHNGNKSLAAREMSISRNWLYKQIERYQILAEEYKA